MKNQKPEKFKTSARQFPKIVFGIDEVGRGPLAGPVVACAIFVSAQYLEDGSGNIKDSKKLTAKQRETIYNALKKNPQVKWGIDKVGEKQIDKINIFQATKLAMQKAVLQLEKKIGKKADLLLIDGNFAIDMERAQQSIIKGDEKVPLISLASIVAKVHRDNLMEKMHQKYPEYGFTNHKGYGTRTHFTAIAKHGPCSIHRASFYPLKQRL